jgi:signal transduction histidine kinase
MSAILSRLRIIWPRSLFARLALVWLVALLVGHLIQNVYSYIAVYDDQIARTDYYLAKDLSVLLPILKTATPAERVSWIKKMERLAYHYQLENFSAETLAKTTLPLSAQWHRNHALSAQLRAELATTYSARSSPGQTTKEAKRLYLSLKDGSTLVVVINKPVWPVDWWGGLVFALQVLAVVAFTWLAVKQATRPLLRLANAAEALGSSLQCEPIPEDGPSEVARAAAAFNAMQRQIGEHLAERVQILAAISHDLQTPITRMRLRADLMDDGMLRDKFQSDLNAMQILVEEGIGYARSAQRVTEEICRVDVDALLDSLVCDYTDASLAVRLLGEVGSIVSTRPNTLKRIIINLLDNALKFAEEVEIQVTLPSPQHIAVAILDRGPGIAEHELAAVLQPFYRVENSRNRSTGGTGLGLAIAQQLSKALQGSITLKNREGGGLEATLTFQRDLKF